MSQYLNNEESGAGEGKYLRGRQLSEYKGLEEEMMDTANGTYRDLELLDNRAQASRGMVIHGVRELGAETPQAL